MSNKIAGKLSDKHKYSSKYKISIDCRFNSWSLLSLLKWSVHWLPSANVCKWLEDEITFEKGKEFGNRHKAVWKELATQGLWSWNIIWKWWEGNDSRVTNSFFYEAISTTQIYWNLPHEFRDLSENIQHLTIWNWHWWRHPIFKVRIQINYRLRSYLQRWILNSK